MRDSYRAFFQKFCINKPLFGAIVIMFLAAGASSLLAGPPIGTFYYPPGNTPPGPPPNYNQVDTSYFSGTPTLPLPPPDSGGVYIWVDSTGWNVANHIYSRGNSLEQFHGSVLAMLASPPTPGVNVFANGFELVSTPNEPSSPDSSGSPCYQQNDRWGWYQWSENLYEIWWDVTTREWKNGNGDPNDFMVINIAGCAIDFNLWSSGHGGPFDTDQVFLGGNMFPLSNVPGFVDTYSGVSDPYQSQAGSQPDHDPNITIFTAISGTGASYNKYGQINPGQFYTCGQVLSQDYGDRFSGPFVYEGNGIQFSSSCLSDPCQFNLPPVAVSPVDTAIFVCDLSEICKPGFTFSDPNNNVLTAEIIGGTLNGDTACFIPVEGYNAVTLVVTDECGASDTATTNVLVVLNTPPVTFCPNDTTIMACDLSSDICLPGFGYHDPDGNLIYFEVIGGVYNNGTVCFTPVEGVNTITLIKGDTCGERDTCVTNITVVLNSPPVAGSLNDTSLFVCDLSPICLPGFSSSDIDGNLSSVTVLGGGTISGDTVCFTPVNGQNTITLVATDSCGVADTATTIVTVNLNAPPVASSPGDTSMFVCDLSQICLPGFNSSDIDGNIATVEVLGGTISGDTVCFTPVNGQNIITLIVTDSCGETDTAATVVTIDLNEPPVASSPNDTSMFVCDLSQICLPGFAVSDPDGNITSIEVVGGALSGDTVCFTPIDGPNTITLIATDACGEIDTAVTVIAITANAAPVTACPGDTTITVCDLADICLPGFGYSDGDGNIESVVISGGTFDNGSICFTPVEGENVLAVTVADSCGFSSTCTTLVNIVVNSSPVITCINDTTMVVDDFSQVCLDNVIITDAEDNITSVVVNGDSVIGNVICFSAVPGVNNVTIIVADACGLADTCVVDVTVGYCAFLPGDANADMSVNGLDITMMVEFFKMGPALPDTCDCRPDVDIYPFFGAGDANGDCAFNGLDVTYLFDYLSMLIDEVLYCPSCPPTWGWVTSLEGNKPPKATISKPENKTGFNNIE